MIPPLPTELKLISVDQSRLVAVDEPRPLFAPQGILAVLIYCPNQALPGDVETSVLTIEPSFAALSIVGHYGSCSYAADAVFMGGKPATAKVISLVVYALEGGLDAGGKSRLIECATDLLGKHAGLSGLIPAYVVIQEVPEANWGIFWIEGNLAALRASPLMPLHFEPTAATGGNRPPD